MHMVVYTHTLSLSLPLPPAAPDHTDTHASFARSLKTDQTARPLLSVGLSCAAAAAAGVAEAAESPECARGGSKGSARKKRDVATGMPAV